MLTSKGETREAFSSRSLHPLYRYSEAVSPWWNRTTDPLILRLARDSHRGAGEVKIGPGGGCRRWRLRLRALELPGGEAAKVNVILVESGIVAVARELDLELQLVLGHRQIAHGARRVDPGAPPRAIGVAFWESCRLGWPLGPFHAGSFRLASGALLTRGAAVCLSGVEQPRCQRVGRRLASTTKPGDRRSRIPRADAPKRKGMVSRGGIEPPTP
jgi:hypothetical protein